MAGNEFEAENQESLVLTEARTSSDTEDIIRQITRPGITPKTVLHLYSQWADTYDQDIHRYEKGYNSPKTVTEELALWLGDRRDARILDCGAGTGLCGVQLSKLGFGNVDAIDPSSVMLEKAKQKGVYKNFICEYLGTNPTSIADETYDAMLGVGVFCNGHITWDSFPEMIRISKPGGYFIFGMSEHHHPPSVNLEDGAGTVSEFEAEILRLQNEDKWTMVRRRIVPNYRDDYTGVIYVMRKVTHSQFKTMHDSGEMDSKYCTIQHGENKM